MTLAGTGFLARATVIFGSAAATSVTVQSSTLITATTPAASAGAVNVTVTNSNGQSASLSGAFTFVSPPTLNSISPASGPTTGGTAVTLAGNGLPERRTVTFGGVASSAVTVQSSTQITAITPPDPAGAVSVTVTNSNAQKANVALVFTYVSPPSPSSISPANGSTAGGTPSRLTGTGFLSGATVISARQHRFKHRCERDPNQP